jgi:hypothetical protein
MILWRRPVPGGFVWECDPASEDAIFEHDCAVMVHRSAPAHGAYRLPQPVVFTPQDRAELVALLSHRPSARRG